MLPLFVQLADRLCVVVGGGPVGQRKARALLDAGARVQLVCLETATLTHDRLTWITEPYQPAHLDGAALVVAAATPGVNATVIADARAHGIWVNAAYNPAAGDFYLPSVVRRGDFLLAIGSMGAAPALSRRVRQKLEHDFDEAFGIWVRLLGELRPAVLSAIADPDVRHELFAQLSAWRWLEHLRREGEAATRAAMHEVVCRRAGSSVE